MLKKKSLIENLEQQKNKIKLSKTKIRGVKNKQLKSYDASKIISENVNINNFYKKSIANDDAKQEHYLKNQIRKINLHNKSLIKNKSAINLEPLKKNMSLPLIYDRKILNHNIANNFYQRQKDKMMEELKLSQKSRNKIGNLKYLQNKYVDNNKENPFFKNLVINQFHNKSQQEFITK